MRVPLVALTLTLGVSSLMSCGSDSGDSQFGGEGGTLGTGGTAFGGKPCTSGADCAAGEFCSSQKVCIPNGSCSADADCAASPGTHCSAVHTCIPTGTCESDQDCDAGFSCQPGDSGTKTCLPGGGCGADEFGAEAVPPNMLIVLDRSCTMREKVDGLMKWEITVDALNTLTTNYTGKIRWGLVLFPDTIGEQCLQEAPAPVPCAAGTETQIQQIMTASLQTADPYYPNGPCVTNIDTAMMQAQNEASLKDPARKNFAVLITDGKQAGCSDAGGDAGTESILGSMFAQGIATFVVGFGGAIDAAQMNRFADAGGMPRNDPTTHYYQADDAQTFAAALGAIAGAVVSCTLTLDQTPPNTDELYVFFNNTSVPRDPGHQNGWDYDPATNTVTFYGSFCDQLKNGQVLDVDVVFGCNQPTPR